MSIAIIFAISLVAFHAIFSTTSKGIVSLLYALPAATYVAYGATLMI